MSAPHSPGPSIHGAVYKPLPCGCAVHGKGTLISPLTIAHCNRHAAAPDMLKALENLDLVTINALGLRKEYLKARTAAYAAIAKARGKA